MPDLTRHSDPRRPDCWFVYYGGVQAGMIAIQQGMPLKPRYGAGTAASTQYRIAGDLAAATLQAPSRPGSTLSPPWRDYLPRCTEADFAEHRQQRWKARKTARHFLALRLVGSESMVVGTK